jgi:hypothetical protein
MHASLSIARTFLSHVSRFQRIAREVIQERDGHVGATGEDCRGECEPILHLITKIPDGRLYLNSHIFARLSSLRLRKSNANTVGIRCEK